MTKITRRRISGILSGVMLCLSAFPAMADDTRTGAYIYSALQNGAAVSVRLDAPDGGCLLFARYQRATRQFLDARAMSVPEGVTGQTLEYIFREAPASTEYIRVFLIDGDGTPLARAVMADYVIPSAD